jgi:hypothetical protein
MQIPCYEVCGKKGGDIPPARLLECLTRLRAVLRCSAQFIEPTVGSDGWARQSESFADFLIVDRDTKSFPGNEPAALPGGAPKGTILELFSPISRQVCHCVSSRVGSVRSGSRPQSDKTTSQDLALTVLPNLLRAIS